MTVRAIALALLIGIVAATVVGLTTLPVLSSALDVLRTNGHNEALVSRLQTTVPLILVLDAIVVSVVAWAFLRSSAHRGVTELEDQLSALLVDDQPSRTTPAPGGSDRIGRAVERLRAQVEAERRRARVQLEVAQRTNAELARLQGELVASDRLATLGKLASGVAHEVGNPLAGVAGYLSILEAKLGDRPDLLELVRRSDAEVQRIDGIVRSLLELGRPSRGQVELIDVRPVVDSTVRLLGASAELRAMSFEVLGPDSLFARAEQGPLAQVLVNLLINAGHAMGGAGRVTVSLAAEGDAAFVRVRDRGPGIAPDVLPRLFELFFTTKAPGKGTGLGLAMSRHLLAQVGGELSAANHPDGGAEFTVRLKASRSA